MQPSKTKSRSFRRVFKRVISKTKVFYEQRKPKAAKCADCGAKLKGVPRLSATKAKNAPKTYKRPERPYGGELCSRCTRIRIKENIK